MKQYTPLEKLNMTIRFQLKDLPYKRRTRISILSHWLNKPISSSSDLTPRDIEKLLNAYFEQWRVEGAFPTEQEKARIRRLAESFSAQWALILKEPEIVS